MSSSRLHIHRSEIMKMESTTWRHCSQLINCKFDANQKFEKPSQHCIVNSFRQKSLEGLQPEGGDACKVTFANEEKCDKAEVFIKTLAIKKKILDVLANPKEGNEVCIKPSIVFQFNY